MNTVDVTGGLSLGTEIVEVEVFAQRYLDSMPVGRPRLFAKVGVGDACWWGIPRDGDPEPRPHGGSRIPWNAEDFPEASPEEVSHALLTLEVKPDRVDVIARSRAGGAFDFLLNGWERLAPSPTSTARAEGRLDFARSGSCIVTVEHGQSNRSLRLMVNIAARGVSRPTTRSVPDEKLAAAAALIREGWWQPFIEAASVGVPTLLAAAAYVAAHPDAGRNKKQSTQDAEVIGRATRIGVRQVRERLRNAQNALYRESDRGPDWHRALRLLNLDTFVVDVSNDAPGQVLHGNRAETSESLQLLARLIELGVLRNGIDFVPWADASTGEGR